jgi:hypothetical protein
MTSLTSLSIPSFCAAVPPKKRPLNHTSRLCASWESKTKASWAQKLFFLLFSIPKPLLSPFMSASIPALPS